MSSAPTFTNIPIAQRVFLPNSDKHPNILSPGQDTDIYKFIKVEDFFNSFPPDAVNSPALTSTVKSYTLHQGDYQLAFTLSDGSCAVLQVVRYDTVRFRWGPGKVSSGDYSQYNSRAVVMDTVPLLRARCAKDDNYTLSLSGSESDAGYQLSVLKDGIEHLKVVIKRQFRIEIWRNVTEVIGPDTQQPPDQRYALVWSTSTPSSSFSPLQSRSDAEGDYATTFCVDKRGKAMGFGEQGGLSVFKDGDMLTYFNYDNLGYSGVYGTQALNPSEPMYHSEPMFVELNAVAGYQSATSTFADNYSQLFLDVGKTGNWYRFGSRFGDLDLWIVAHDTIRDVIHAYTSFVGRQKLIPRFILGYHQGCYGYDTRDKCINAVQKYRDYNFPLDGLHIDVDLQRGYRTFTSDPNDFSDLKGMFATIRNMGVKCSTNITPIIANSDDGGYPTLEQGLAQNCFVLEQRWNVGNGDTVQVYEGGNQNIFDMQILGGLNSGNPYIGAVSYGPGLGINGLYPEFGSKYVRDWWGSQYGYLFDNGLEFVWQDMTTPAIASQVGDMKGFPFRLLLQDDSISGSSDAGRLTPALKIWNLYSYNLHKATYKGLQTLTSRANKRNFIIGRGSFTGMHRWAGLWTGDDISSWDFLRIQIQQVLSMGVCGISLTGSDVGGFEAFPFDAQWADPQLVIRWMMACTLLPWFRNHYNGKPGHKLFQEPWAYYEHADNVPSQAPLYRAVLTICRYYVRLRYTLLQLLYDAHFENISYGLPIVRAMVITDPFDLSLFDEREGFVSSQYVIGDHLFVAPVIEQGTAARDIYLPQGSLYYDFNLHLGGDGNGGGQSDPVDGYLPLQRAHAGGQVLPYTTSIDQYVNGDVAHLPYLLPMFVREGGIIPIRQLELYAGQKSVNTLTVHFYPLSAGRQTTYSVYLDDGVGLDSAPTDLPQFEEDPKSGAGDKYRQLLFTQVSDATGKTRSITMTQPQTKWPLSSVQGLVGSTYTLVIWHPPSSSQPTVQPSATFNSSWNAHVLEIPVDDAQHSVQVAYN